jgi:hypothetical protein
MFFRRVFGSILLLLSLCTFMIASPAPQNLCAAAGDGNPLPCTQQKQYPTCTYCSSNTNFFQWCVNGSTFFAGKCPTTCDSHSKGCSCPRSSLTQSECSSDRGQGVCDRRGFCICSEGYGGPACEHEIMRNLCTSKKDGIYCNSQGQQYHCKGGILITTIGCNYGCQDDVGCLCPNNCTNYGTCRSKTTHGVCECESGYVDDDCSLGPITIRGLWSTVWNKQLRVNIALENCYIMGERCGIVDWRTSQCAGLVTYEGTSVIGTANKEFGGRKAMLFSYEITCNYGCSGNVPNFGQIEIVRRNSGTGHYIWWGVFLNRNHSENTFLSYYKDPVVHPSCNPFSPSSSPNPPSSAPTITPAVSPPSNSSTPTPKPHLLPIATIVESDRSSEKFLQAHLIPIIVGVFISGLLIGVLGVSATIFIRTKIRNSKQNTEYALVD